MTKLRRLSLVLLTLFVALTFVPVAYAHPLGNFTINHYAGLNIHPQKIEVDYVLDMAEIPAFQEMTIIDKNRDGKTESNETDYYRTTKCEAIRNDLLLRIGDREVRLVLDESSLTFPAGQGGLSTLRLNCIYSAYPSELQDGADAVQVDFIDHTNANRLGWREIGGFYEQEYQQSACFVSKRSAVKPARPAAGVL